jgi:ABC-type transport system involved in multi-copper enzyme maturation permease subunit
MEHAHPAAATASHWKRIRGISRYTLLEAWRNRFLALVAALIVFLYVASLFVKELAITESAQIQTGFLAAAVRLVAVFLVALHVLQGLSRDFQDKGVEIILSLDLPRAGYVLGKFGGHLVLVVAVSILCMLPFFTLSLPGAALRWGASLMLELSLVAAAAIFCMVTFSQLFGAATFVAGFYLLGRSITAIQLMSTSTLAGTELGSRAAAFLADAISFLLPRLDTFTQSAWLIGVPGVPHRFADAALQTLIYVALLLGAALFDLHRRSF